MLGLFYNLKITTILFIFAIANIIGIAPGVGAVEKFFLLKVIFEKKLFLSGIVFIINFVSLGIFSWKIFYPLFRKPSEPKPADDINLAKDIDYDSSLILTALIVAIAIFLSLVFFPFLTDFL
jgi:formate hydrogenlyase subunit 3/multisubunit Na+/H+ antiporter MnhD subunit